MVLISAAVLLPVDSTRAQPNSKIGSQPSSSPTTAPEPENIRLQRDRLEFDKEKSKSDAERAERANKVEESKVIWSALATFVPLALGVIAVVVGVFNQNRQAKHQFELKAAEIIFSGATPQAILSRGVTLKTIFGSKLSKSFLRDLTLADIGGYKEPSDEKRAFFDYVLKNPDKKREIVHLWFLLFPGDFRWLIRFAPHQFKDINLPEIQELLDSKELEQIASAAKGHVGVAAVVLETGESVSLNPHHHFPTQGIYNLPIALTVMKQVDAGKILLDQKVRVTKNDFVRADQYSPIRDQNRNGVELTVNYLIAAMLQDTDGTASDVLLNLAGGPEAVQAYLRELMITEWSVLNTEKEIGNDWQTQYRNWATPKAAVDLLRALHERVGLSQMAHDLLLKLMAETTREPDRLKALLPANTVVVHKTGTSGRQNGVTAATNDIGIITLPDGRHLAIAAFVSDSPTDEATREGVIAKVAKVAWEKFTAASRLAR